MRQGKRRQSQDVQEVYARQVLQSYVLTGIIGRNIKLNAKTCAAKLRR